MRDLLTQSVRQEQDVMTARQQAAHIAVLLGFDPSQQTRIAAAVAEIAGNAVRHASGAKVAFTIDTYARPQRLLIRVSDTGPGIPNLRDVMSGHGGSGTVDAGGIVAAQRLMDGFSIDSSEAGTNVLLEQFLPPGAPLITHESARQLTERVGHQRPPDPVEALRQQNDLLLRALDELQRKQHELARLDRELEDTNRGVVALYAELDEKAGHLRRADDLKSRFLSNMTHEFRTPVNAIIGLSKLILDDRRQEGREPEPEIIFIREAAEQLSALVNDLLDLAKVEAGKTVVRAADFEVSNLFGALRGMFKPLLLNPFVSLIFEEAGDLPPVYSDEGKLSQILRNLISNALKFTERGEVRVSARLDDSGTMVMFAVTDTGIGIAAEDESRIFEEFAQLEHKLQIPVRGTGLGLPLSRKLTELLGGTLSLTSEPGVGSSFFVVVPRHYRETAPVAAVLESGSGTLRPLGAEDAVRRAQQPTLRVLNIDDDETSRYVVRQCLSAPAFEVLEAATPEEGLRLARAEEPNVILLDLIMPGLNGYQVLERLSDDAATRDIPVLIVTASALEPEERAQLLLHATEVLSKAQASRDVLTDAVRRAAGTHVRPGSPL